MRKRLFILVLLIGITLSNDNFLYGNFEPCHLNITYHADYLVLQMAMDTIPASTEDQGMNSIVFIIDTTYTGHSLEATEFVNQKAIIQSASRFDDKSIERAIPLPYMIVYWHLLIQRYIFDLK